MWHEISLHPKFINFITLYTSTLFIPLPSMTNYCAAVSAGGIEVFLLIFSNQLIFGGETDGCYGPPLPEGYFPTNSCHLCCPDTHLNYLQAPNCFSKIRPLEFQQPADFCHLQNHASKEPRK